MSRFSYVAKGPHGNIQGTLEAASASAAASEIQAKGLVPLTIKQDGPVAAAAAASAPVKMPEFMQPKVTQMDVMLFAKQLYTLFKAGVPILRALAGLQETTQNPTMKVVLQDLRRALEGGVDLSTAMAQHPKCFDGFFVAMVKVGESSGRLEEIFLRLAQHMEFEMFMQQQVKSALRYPSFVIMAMTAAIGVINVMVIPAFSGVFKGLGADLPVPTKILMATSAFSIEHGWSILIAAVLAFFVWRKWVKSPQGKPVWDRFLLRMPIVGPIVTKASLARFTRAFALSLRSGVPLERALIGVAQTADNAYLTQQIDSMRERIMRGESLAHSAASAGVFTPMVLQMIAIGEETGMVDELLDEVGELYSEDVQYLLKTLSQQIEPILIVFMGGLVLVLALGVFLPMWNMGGAAMKH
ncbi:MAG: type II secretion system F family protein [Aquabacterium sp.]|uniref:type II secretion system F family protein n=1 Tax=Aquabacterium sp. TaxID=1872578 RepID=UPI0025BAF0C3|nr:type II secretion system F family protein [Aquabacterium sp.]MBI5927549.1 type II secretion system F family protein [Aquabacterium sp.]